MSDSVDILASQLQKAIDTKDKNKKTWSRKINVAKLPHFFVERR